MNLIKTCNYYNFLLPTIIIRRKYATCVPAASSCGVADSFLAESSASWVTVAAAAPEAAHSAEGLVWKAVKELVVVAEAEVGLEVEEAPE